MAVGIEKRRLRALAAKAERKLSRSSIAIHYARQIEAAADEADADPGSGCAVYMESSEARLIAKELRRLDRIERSAGKPAF